MRKPVTLTDEELTPLVFAHYKHILLTLRDLFEVETFDDIFQAAEKVIAENKELFADYGYANGWGEDPARVARCKKLGHTVNEYRDRNASSMGHVHVVRCDKCRYVYRYDSS